VTEMNGMFYSASTFNQDISNWCVSNIVSEPSDFSLNPPLIESNKPVWGTCPSNLTPITDANFYQAIETCLSTNPVDGMCSDSEYGAMPDWDVSQVTDMSSAFDTISYFNADISAWNVSSVTIMNRIFNEASSFNQDLSNWCVTNIDSEPDLFSYNSPLTEINKPVWGTCLSPCVPTESNITFLPDGNGSSYETSITVDCFDPDQILEDVNQLLQICIVIEHSYLGDLDIEIIAPSSQTVLLQGQSGSSANLGIPWATGPIDGSSDNSTMGVGSQYCFTIDDSLPSLEDNLEFGDFPAGDTAGTYQDSFTPAGTYSSDESLQGLVGTPLNGNWTIRITDNLVVDNGYIFSWTLDFDYTNFPTLGVDDQNQLDISIYPNPVIDKLFIKGLSNPTKISVYDLLGKLVLSKTISSEINVDNLQSGIYIVKIVDNQKEIVRKFIKN
jgi:subtilisin-like proprotein convertase family protein